MSQRTIAVIGLGYVGLPVAVAFGRAGLRTIGFDINRQRIDELRSGIDRTREVEADDLHHPALSFASDADELAAALRDQRIDVQRIDVVAMDPDSAADTGHEEHAADERDPVEHDAHAGQLGDDDRDALAERETGEPSQADNAPIAVAGSTHDPAVGEGVLDVRA